MTRTRAGVVEPSGNALGVATLGAGKFDSHPPAGGREVVTEHVTQARESQESSAPPTNRDIEVAPRPTSTMSPARAAAVVVVVGLLITATVSWVAWSLNRHNERGLLEVQTRQAAAVLGATVLSIRDPLATALQIELATDGSADQFGQFAASYVGPDKLFVSATLWRATGTAWAPASTAGMPSLVNSNSPVAIHLIDKALHSPTFVVASVREGRSQRIAYVIADPTDPTIAIYAERAIPANRQVPVESSSAFSDLDFATYVGSTTSLSALATTDVPVADLPIRGTTAHESVPFGDTTITLVASPRGPLGGTLGGELPWIFLAGGIVLTLGTALVTFQLVSRRRKAEDDAQTIAGLYDQLDSLYGHQRTISETLQQALLPQRNPSIANLEVASRYVAGANGEQIGGDWFSVVALDDHHFAFAVGDVSGKGVAAAATMARMRFTIRAYLTEGHPPDVVLEMCSRQLSVSRDGHLSTVLVGIGDVGTGTITLANAGHLQPLLVAGSEASFATTAVGLPLGVAPSHYRSSTVRMPSGSVFVAYTDGLIERRGESIDVGQDRLAQAALGPFATVDQLLSTLTTSVSGPVSDDDVTVLAFRWTSPTEGHDGTPGGADATPVMSTTNGERHH